MIKGSFKGKAIIVNIYAPNIRQPQYIKQMLTAIKEEIDSSTIIVGDFNTPLSSIDRWSKALNDTLDQMDLTDIYKEFHPKAAEYTWHIL